MSYLLPAGSVARTKNKWGLGVYRSRIPRSRGIQGLGLWKLYQQSGGPGALGQDYNITTGPMPQSSPDCPGSVIDPITGELCANLPPLPAAPSDRPPQQPGVNPAVQAAYANLLTQQQNSQNPLDYVSPQAAIAAGLPPQTVYNAWSNAMARFPSQQAALNAGIPAGVVTQLWAQSRAAVPAASTNTFLGVPVTYLLGGGFALLLLTGLRRK